MSDHFALEYAASLRFPLRSLSLRLAKSPARRTVLPDTMPTPASSSSRRRYAPRSSPSSLRSPPPPTPVAGIAPARRGSTPCVAGAGFAAHRALHRARQCCPHDCGQRRRRLRQRAAHDCPRLRPLRPPLSRRVGSPPPGSPASIPPSLSLGFVAIWTPFGVSVSHRNAAGCRARHGVTGDALRVPINHMRRQNAPGASRSERVLQSTRVLSHSCHRVASPVPRKHRSVAPACRAHCGALR